MDAAWLPVLGRGVLLGLGIAAPVGPIGLLCIRRSISEGRLAGLCTGLGAATADALYGAVAALGLTAISGFMVAQRMWMQGLGGLFLIYLGVMTFRARPSQAPAGGTRTGLWRAYSSTLLLTLTNPMTILSFAAMFAGLGIGVRRGDASSAAALMVGVLLGSGMWWLLLSSSAGFLGGRLGLRELTWVNRGSGVLIAGFGVVAVWMGISLE